MGRHVTLAGSKMLIFLIMKDDVAILELFRQENNLISVGRKNSKLTNLIPVD